MFRDAQDEYDRNGNRIHELDKLTQDYLHKLELGDLNYAERAKVATKLRNCRQERRQCKDTTENLHPLISFLESEKGRQAQNLLNEVLGKTRKIKYIQQNRRYSPRVDKGGLND